MFRPLFVFIGTRYTRAKRRNHFVSFISLTSMIGLALGVVVMIVVLSVMNGFDHEMRTRVLGMVPHATIEGDAPISIGIVTHIRPLPRRSARQGFNVIQLQV